MLYVEDSLLNLIRDATSTEKTWNRPKNFRNKTTSTSGVSVLRRICSLNMVEGGNVEQHFVELEKLFDWSGARGSASGRYDLSEPSKIFWKFGDCPGKSPGWKPDDRTGEAETPGRISTAVLTIVMYR